MRRLVGVLKLDGAPEACLRILESPERGIQGPEIVMRHRIERVDPSDALERFDGKLGVALQLVDESEVVVNIRIVRGELERTLERRPSPIEVTLVEIGDAEVDVAGRLLGHEPVERFERLTSISKAELLEQSDTPVRVSFGLVRLGLHESWQRTSHKQHNYNDLRG